MRRAQTVNLHAEWIDLTQLTNYKIQEEKLEKYFQHDEPFTQAQGFQVAAAITSYDGSSESIEDEEIGTIKMYIKWSGEDNPEATEDQKLGFSEIKTKLCDPERDLNNEGGSST